jgi:hypothetical protein
MSISTATQVLTTTSDYNEKRRNAPIADVGDRFLMASQGGG